MMETETTPTRKPRKSRRRGPGEGSVYQRKDGRWAATITVADGGRRLRKTYYGRSRAEVVAKVGDAGYDLRRGIKPANDRVTVKSFLESWLARKASSLRPATHESYSEICRLYLIPGLGSTSLAKLSVAAVQGFIDGLTAKRWTDDDGTECRLSPRRIAYVRAVLRSALSTAMKQELVVRNVAKLVEVPPASPHPPVVLTPEQAQELLKHIAGTRDEALLLLALTTGLRRGELVGLRWDDVDLEAGILSVRRALQRKPGGGHRVVEPKSKTSKRTIYIPAITVAALKRHRALQAQAQLAAGPRWQGTEGYVFTNWDGRPRQGQRVYQHFLKLLAAAGLPRTTLHALRHGIISYLGAAGVPVKDISTFVGHSSSALTLAVYTHSLPQGSRNTADKAGALFDTASK